MLKLETKLKEELLGCDGRLGLAIEIGNEQFLYQSEAVFQSASVIKVPILIEGLRQSDQGKIKLDEVTAITNKVGGSGVLQALSGHARMTIKDLMTLMITVSDNTATNMLIDLLGMESINLTMEKLGLSNTVLNRKMMDFEAIERGWDNFTSPIDMITCLKAVNEGSFLAKESKKAALEMMNNQQFLDKLPAMMDLDKIFVANKTGGLPGVEHDCAVIKYRGKTAYIAVLMDKLNDVSAGTQTISRIGRRLYEYLLEET
ncbi:serine hydrolase [Neobacillus soli]|uniref:serine hydrolase n=1 Tax=Neobacillus soli TaxID=220688 RepID=UPI0008260BCF|nr:serine hydrolase [Neobacillus soli]